jgi:hypothetical protein
MSDNHDKEYYIGSLVVKFFLLLLVAYVVNFFTGCSTMHNIVGKRQQPDIIPKNYELAGREPCLNEAEILKKTIEFKSNDSLMEYPSSKKNVKEDQSKESNTVTVNVKPMEQKLIKDHHSVNDAVVSLPLFSHTLNDLACCRLVFKNKRKGIVVTYKLPPRCTKRGLDNLLQYCKSYSLRRREFRSCVDSDSSILVNPFIMFRQQKGDLNVEQN